MGANRNIAPAINEIDSIAFSPCRQETLAGIIPLYLVNDPNLDVLKIEMVFDAGLRSQTKPYLATAANALLVEGTTSFTSKEIAEKLDFYGAYLQNRSGSDDATLTLFCLPKHLESCLPYITDILLNATYAEEELLTQKENAIQRLLVNENKTAFLARRCFYETVFGKTNPYGTPVYQEDIQNISRETLLSFYETNYRGCLKYIFVSGRVDESTILGIKQAFASFVLHKKAASAYVATPSEVRQIKLAKPGAVQSTIRVGRRLFNRAHKDFRQMQLLNLVLGGYFGSRLMSNIREEKGLTYGIYSAMESYIDDGVFYIETDVNNELVGLAINEIYKEIEILRSEPIGKDELETAKNYMLGSFLRSFDGVFEQASRNRILIDYGLSNQYYDEFVEIIKNTDSLTLQGLANNYLKQEDFYEVIAGS